MRVGLNVLFLGDGAGGVGRYSVELAGALAALDDVELHLFLTPDGLEVLRNEPWLDSVSARVLPVKREGRAGYLAATFLAMPGTASAARLDVLHSPANVGPFLVPGVRTLITVHDLIWKRLGPEWDSPEAVAAMQRATALTVSRADRIITDSQASEADLVSMIGLPASRIDVVPLGVRSAPDASHTPADELRRRYGLGETAPIVLCVAQKRPYKGQDRLVRALAEIPDDAALVLPGAPTDFELELKALANELGIGSRVAFPGWIDDRDLEGFYRAATCFALASDIEGFGLPVLEAMARGVPVACSDRSSLAEVASGAALLFDPDDQSSVTGALGQLLSSRELREELSAAGRERAAEYTWNRTAQETLDSYRRALAEH